jgi:hypothetical protein
MRQSWTRRTATLTIELECEEDGRWIAEVPELLGVQLAVSNQREVRLEDRLLAIWHEASLDLGVRCEAPFRLRLNSGVTVVARLLLRDFGAVNGMLIVTDYSRLRAYTEEIVAAGFGYSTLSEPSPDEKYDRESFIEMLQDWGWAGPEHLRPSWWPASEIDADE